MASIVNKYHLITSDRLDEMKQGLRNLPMNEGVVPELKPEVGDEDTNETPMDEDIDDDEDEVDEVETAIVDKTNGSVGQAGGQSDIVSVPSSSPFLDDSDGEVVLNASNGSADVRDDSESNDAGIQSNFNEMNKFNASMMQARMRMQKSRVNRDMSIKSRRAKVEEEWICF